MEACMALVCLIGLDQGDSIASGGISAGPSSIRARSMHHCICAYRSPTFEICILKRSFIRTDIASISVQNLPPTFDSFTTARVHQLLLKRGACILE